MTNFKVPTGITRFEYQGCKGWYVKVWREKVRFQKLFSDGVYGSPENALEKAKEYLNEIHKAFPFSRKEYIKSLLKVDGNTIRGVWKQQGITKGHTYWFWNAIWCPKPGSVKTKRFSINKYGDDGARKLAIQARIKGIENLKDEWPEGYNNQIKEIPEEFLNVGLFGTNIRTVSNRNVNPIHFSYEGKKKYKLHQKIERDRSLRERKIQSFIDENKDIYCELCGFNYMDKYPWLSKEIIEVHHIIPLSEIAKESKVYIDDLILLCSNCHTAIHQGNAQDNLIEASIHFNKDIIK